MSVRNFGKILKSNFTVYQRVWLTKFMYQHSPEQYTDADPFKIVYIDPNSIKYIQLPFNKIENSFNIYTDNKGRFDKYNNIGRVYDGDWDTNIGVTEHHCNIHRLLYDRFWRNMRWDESDTYRNFADQIQKGNTVWHSCSTIKELNYRAAVVEELYDNIAENGYTSKHRVGIKDNDSLEQQLKKIDVTNRLNEVTVNIDRNGNFLPNSSGTHRLVIAKLVGIKQLSVRILLRLRKWQDIRNDILGSKRIADCSIRTKSLLSNPDL